MSFMNSSNLDCNNSINAVNSTQTRFKIYLMLLFLASLYIGEILCSSNANDTHTHQTALFNSSIHSFELHSHQTRCDVQKRSLAFYVILIGISAHILLLKTPKQRCYVILNACLIFASSGLATCFALFTNGQTMLSIMHCFIILSTFVLFFLHCFWIIHLLGYSVFFTRLCNCVIFSSCCSRKTSSLLWFVRRWRKMLRYTFSSVCLRLFKSANSKEEGIEFCLNMCWTSSVFFVVGDEIRDVNGMYYIGVFMKKIIINL